MIYKEGHMILFIFYYLLRGDYMTRLEKIVANFFKYLFIWEVGGLVYYLIEIFYRGHSHPSMFILGGLCLVLVGLLNELFSFDMYFELQVLIGDVIVLLGEFSTGLIVNVWLGLGVWDYSDLKFNIMGQICPQFALLWLPIVAVAILMDDWIRYQYFHEEDPHYKFFIKEKIISKIR